jgi:hypothetical protein
MNVYSVHRGELAEHNLTEAGDSVADASKALKEIDKNLELLFCM